MAEKEADGLVFDSEGKTTLPICEKHGVHTNYVTFDLGAHGPAEYCAYCLAERLDGLGVNRMQYVKLTKDQVDEIKAQSQPSVEAAE